eukprot:scaffold211349_cov17-Prasinocladus_malaysianus.AAC.1
MSRIGAHRTKNGLVDTTSDEKVASLIDVPMSPRNNSSNLRLSIVLIEFGGHPHGRGGNTTSTKMSSAAQAA